MKKLTPKQAREKYHKTGLKMRLAKAKVAKVEKEDVFLNEDSKVVVEDAFVSQPSREQVREVLADLDGYRDWARANRGDGLTFGDY